MPTGDAVQERPTMEQEIAKFKGFSMTNGEISDGSQTDEETERLAEIAAQEARDKVLAKKNPQADALQQSQQQQQVDGQQQQQTTEETDEDEDENAEGDQQQQQGKKPNKMTADARVKQAVARQRRAERERDSERARHASEMSSLTARLTALENGGGRGQQQQQQPEFPGRPDPSKFELGELDPKYIDALADWKVDQKLTEREQRNRQQTVTREQQENSRKFEEAKAEVTERGTAKYDDFEDVVLGNAYNPQTNPTGWLLSETLGKLALTSPVGEDVLYHLATHPKEAAQVYGKTPMEQAAYFGRMETKFSPAAGATDKSQQQQQQDGTSQQRSQQQQVRTPKAPPPPQNRGRGAGAKSSVSADTTDFAAFERLATGRSN